ncbi:uncharacterized protein KY384_009114 [Bacidia gigantensis]|uniref:uncharacterized protein n=1 Tax=Bacidia gigantensis TaxID=2732470 RepID=UPI001D03F1CE|nr:uncharacterized protein KY384_009114 [Bacidia gigantensis]KAG8525470.1 hypothetical protein KY384_009114 [Bacidia gigantensis]
MSSFFTTPKSQRKRKREQVSQLESSKKSRATNVKSKKPSQERDKSISGSEDEVEDSKADAIDEGEEGSSSEDETAAERRLRLAEQYLEKIKGDVQEDVGFNAEDVDRDLIAERLQEDVAETKGRLYKHIASDFDFPRANKVDFRMKTASVTGIAVCPPYAYTVSKDGCITKWQLPPPSFQRNPNKSPKKPLKPSRRRPTHIAHISPSRKTDKNTPHRTASILAVAASSTGKYIATGSLDHKLTLYNSSLEPLKSFSHHRDSITSLIFRQGTNQLFSASRDRTVKVWAADERAYVETLFGHQDEIVGVGATYAVWEPGIGLRECGKWWKRRNWCFVEGGGGKKAPSKGVDGAGNRSEEVKTFAEGSIDCIAIVDNETFVTGSDNGSLCLWSLQKKKPVFVLPLAHGLEEPMRYNEASAELHLGPNFKLPECQPRWITALKALPLSDLIVSGSWDGWIRVWKVGKGKRALEPLGALGRVETDDVESGSMIKGVVNDVEIFEQGERGKEGLSIVAAVGKEHRLGRWRRAEGKNGAVMWEVSRKWIKKGKTAKATEEDTHEKSGNTLDMTDMTDMA